MSSISRVNARSASPEVDSALTKLNASAHRFATEAGLTPKLIELIQIRASQINGCAFCLRIHTRKAVEAGETADRLGVLAAWRESGYFTAAERAALDLSEATTLFTDGHVSDEVYDSASEHLDESQIAAVIWLGVVINSYNRVITASRVAVVPD